MSDYVTREEFEARVGVLEQEVEGEKLVTRHILEQTRRNGDDLAAVKTRLGRVETGLGEVKKELADVRNELRGLSNTVQGLLKNLPRMVGDVMREVLAKNYRGD